MEDPVYGKKDDASWNAVREEEAHSSEFSEWSRSFIWVTYLREISKDNSLWVQESPVAGSLSIVCNSLLCDILGLRGKTQTLEQISQFVIYLS